MMRRGVGERIVKSEAGQGPLIGHGSEWEKADNKEQNNTTAKEKVVVKHGVLNRHPPWLSNALEPHHHAPMALCMRPRRRAKPRREDAMQLLLWAQALVAVTRVMRHPHTHVKGVHTDAPANRYSPVSGTRNFSDASRATQNRATWAIHALHPAALHRMTPPHACSVVCSDLPRQDDNVVAYRSCTVNAGSRRQLCAVECQALARTVLMLLNLIGGSSISPLICQGDEGAKGRKCSGPFMR